MTEGLFEIFLDAKAVISAPTCGPCLGGHMGILAEGERAVATTNRNFVGRMGHPGSEVYLANPAIAAASAVLGRIASPDELKGVPSTMKFTGRIWKFGDHINTDLIIPARYINSMDPAFLAAHCMEDIDPDFVKKIKPGDIIVAGENFGCGSSREHAPIAIKAAGIACVIAKSFARIFYRSAFNMGLPIFESRDLYERATEGDRIEVDGDEGWIRISGSRP